MIAGGVVRLPERLHPRAAGAPDAVAETSPVYRIVPGGIVLEEVERDFIRQALELTQGNQTRAAEALGLTRDALRYRIKKFGIL